MCGRFADVALLRIVVGGEVSIGDWSHRRISRILARLGWDDPVVITTLPYAADLVQTLPRKGLIYYCTDDFSHWPGADRAALQAAEQETTVRANMVLAVSEVLQARFAGHRACHYFPHGVDLEHFGSVQRCSPALADGQLASSTNRIFRPDLRKVGFRAIGCRRPEEFQR